MANQQDIMKRIMEIQRDPNLSDAEKAVQRQLVMSGKWAAPAAEEAGMGSGFAWACLPGRPSGHRGTARMLLLGTPVVGRGL